MPTAVENSVPLAEGLSSNQAGGQGHGTGGGTSSPGAPPIVTSLTGITPQDLTGGDDHARSFILGAPTQPDSGGAILGNQPFAEYVTFGGGHSEDDSGGGTTPLVTPPGPPNLLLYSVTDPGFMTPVPTFGQLTSPLF